MRWDKKGLQGSFIGILFLASASVGCGGGGGGTTDGGFTATADSGSTQSRGESQIEGMTLGEVQFLDFGSGESADVHFSGSATEGTYVAVLHSTNIREGDFNLVIQSSLSPSENQALASLGVQEADHDDGGEENPMHESMRAWEEAIANDPDMIPADEVVSSLSIQAMMAESAVGDVETFRVLNSLNSVTSHDVVDAELRYISDDILLYVDVEVSDSNELSDSAIADLVKDFEDHAMPMERNLFGSESDVNGDGRITIVMTPVLNRICNSSGIVTGFFFPGDLYARDGSNPASNMQEIFYTMVPDSRGDYCRPVSASFVMDNILPGVLAHEYQHMISFNQHVLVRGGSTEESWLNEALSHLAEDITGFGLENYARIAVFLNYIDSTTLIPYGLPTLPERGMGFMFLRYLYEQAGNKTAFLNQLVQTSQTGVTNLVNAFPSTRSDFDEFSEFYAYWQVALVLTGTGTTSDPRFTYADRTVDSTTGNYKGICLNCDAQDGRGTILKSPSLSTVNSFPISVSLSSTGGRFFLISDPGEDLTISGGSGAELGGALIRLEN